MAAMEKQLTAPRIAPTSTGRVRSSSMLCVELMNTNRPTVSAMNPGEATSSIVANATNNPPNRLILRACAVVKGESPRAMSLHMPRSVSAPTPQMTRCMGAAIIGTMPEESNEAPLKIRMTATIVATTAQTKLSPTSPVNSMLSLRPSRCIFARDSSICWALLAIPTSRIGANRHNGCIFSIILSSFDCPKCDDMFHPLTSTRDSPYDTIAMRTCRAHYPDERMHVVAFASELAAGILQLLTYMGLKDVSTKNKWRLWLLVAMTFVAFAAASLFALHLLGNVATAVSAFAGQGASAVPAILSYAIVRTSLSEELLFRGFLLKRLVGKFGFTIGNITQSLLFGLIHGIAFFRAAGLQAAIGLVILTASIGYVMGYINERKAGGSILPSWCIHAAANVLAGLLCALYA